MINSCGSNGFYIVNSRCMYNGRLIPSPPRFNKNRVNVTTINNKIYLNGYEYFPNKRKWKVTFKSIWYYLF